MSPLTTVHCTLQVHELQGTQAKNNINNNIHLTMQVLGWGLHKIIIATYSYIIEGVDFKNRIFYKQ